jgi:glycosyltransferase involved in cell wall biosynthesis
MPKICIIITVDISLDSLFPDFYPTLIAKGYEVVGICADGPRVENVRRQGVRVITVPMTREFTPLKDLKSLWQLYKVFNREKFDIIHFSTPKASLLASIAGRISCGPVLLYTLRGLGYTAYTGLKRHIARCCEKITCACADYIIAISHSLKEYVVNEGIVSGRKVYVLGQGSSKGVNLKTFNLNGEVKIKSSQIRDELGIDYGDIVLGYAGRLTEEKGIVEFYRAFQNIRNNNVHMLLVGDQDERNPLPEPFMSQIEKDIRVHRIDFQEELPPYIAAMDVFVMPSYREGFGNSIIEASAMEKPVIATDIPGCKDAIKDGQTGILVKPRDVKVLQQAIERLIASPGERKLMGQNGLKWVKENFSRDLVWARTLEVYEKMLSKSQAATTK